jgi:hypothetical protein
MNTPNVTLFEKKGEVKAGGGLTIKDLEVQLGYSITKSIATQSNTFLGTRGQVYSEILAGYYWKHKAFHSETFLGAGLANLNYNVTPDFYPINYEWIRVNCHYYKFPLQQHLAFHFDERTAIFLAMRYSYLYYDNYSFNYKKGDSGDYETSKSQHSDSTSTTGANGSLFDVYVDCKIGILRLQAGYSFHSDLGIPHQEYTSQSIWGFTHPIYHPFTMSATIVIPMGTIGTFKKNSQPIDEL